MTEEQEKQLLGIYIAQFRAMHHEAADRSIATNALMCAAVVESVSLIGLDATISWFKGVTAKFEKGPDDWLGKNDKWPKLTHK